jgi:RHS repeat-associated protein
MSIKTVRNSSVLIALLALTLLLPQSGLAQTAAPTVRELVPSTAPAGARVFVTGRGLADPAITVAFTGATGNAAVVQRNDRFVEVLVPAAATSGNVRVSLGSTLVREVPFTVASDVNYVVSTLAGGKDSKNKVLKHPNGAAVVLPDGTVAVADEQHHEIKLVSPAGVITVLAGAGKQGLKDGKGLAAEFKDPRGIAFDAVRRVLFVADSGNSAIRQVALDGTVTTLAGHSGKLGYVDGKGAAAQFKTPSSLTVGADGAIYVADTKNNRIRKVLVDGTVTTFAGTGEKGTQLTNGALLTATFNEPRGIVASGNTLFVADTKNNSIRRIENGQVTTVLSYPRSGDEDDPADETTPGTPNALKRPIGIGVDENGDLIVADSENDYVRKIKMSVTPPALLTIAGTGKNGEVNGDGAIAQFKDPAGLSVGGAIFLADEDNDALRRLCPAVKATGMFVPGGALAAGTEVRLFGTGFVPGVTAVKFDNVAATSVTWISATTMLAKLPAAITGGSVSVVISSCGGTTAPATFVVDNTPPVLTITNGGAPLLDGSQFRVPVTPVITATDDVDPNPAITATLNTSSFVSNTIVNVDGSYTLYARADDAAGNRTEQTVRFLIDQTPPVVEVLEKTAPFPAGSWFNRPVLIDLKVTDATPTTSAQNIDGTGYTLKAPYAIEGTHNFNAVVTDALGNSTTVGPVEFTIDLTPPALTWTSHTQGQSLSTREVTLTGGSDDAITVTVNGVAATVDLAAKTFTVPFTLAEGENVITATGTDRAGNIGTAVLKLVLDTRAPQLAIVAPAASLCTNANTIAVSGTVSDIAVAKVIVKLGDATIEATLDAAKRNWSASIPAGPEGRKSITVEATDDANHTAVEQVAIVVDRTEPAIELQESGSPFTATLVGKKVSLFVRSTDADEAASMTVTLNGAAYTSGTEIAAERAHTIRIVASDCAGNTATREQTFTIDLTPPKFLSFNPLNGSKHTTAPGSLSGTTDADAVEVRVIGRGITVPVSNGSFTIPNIGFADGVNERSLEVVDRVGHTGQAAYTIGVRTSQPLIDIVERGESMVDNTVYTRAVEPVVRVFDDGVTFSATLNGAPFTNGTVVSDNGTYTLSATATDTEFDTNNSITRRFTIDRTAPAVKILSPANGATFANEIDRTPVVASSSDASTVTINGIAAAKQSDGNWLASVPLDLGENDIVAVASDTHGNSATDSIAVTRGTAGPAIVLTFPPNNYLTNRPLLDVTGRVLRPSSSVAVTVPPAAAASVAVDPAGLFRLNSAELAEGETTITAIATEGGKSTPVSVKVMADFTPPRVRILEGGQPLAEGATFATQAVISGDATDKNEPIAFTLTIDGAPASGTTTVTAVGGHTALITTRDAAGNESRLERTFYIGSTSAGGCALSGFDPADGSVITQQKVELIGRSGGAIGVKVNGIPAKMAAGSFCASVELPNEGPNEVVIVCTDANGNPVGEEKRITLHRVTYEPSVSITFPPEGHVTHDEVLIVNGTLGNGAIAVDLNGKPATINGSNWTATDVRLQDGINVLVAIARNSGGRTATASRRVTYMEDLPSITITSPVPNYISGIAKVDVSGTWLNVDPNSLAIEGYVATITPTPFSDTTGRFVIHDVPLQSGSNTIKVSGVDRTGRPARAEVIVKYTPGLATLAIASPADNHYFGAGAGANFRVSGTFTAPDRSTIDVNGVTATISGNTFAADVPFSTLASGMTPVVARVSPPDGSDGAFDSLRVFKLGAPKVIETFPAADALEVDPGVVVLVLFSAPMDKASTVAAFRLENANGTAINGRAWLDKDVLTFAPATTLTPGERYTVKIATSATDVAEQNLEAGVTQSFTVATTASTNAPTLLTANGRICAQTVDVNGTTTPGTRVRLDYGQLTFTTTASATGAFTYRIALTGQQGFHIVRVRSVGADGTYSPSAELKLNVDCAGPRVQSASYERPVNKLTIVFTRDVKASTLTTGTGGSLQLVLNDGRIVAGDVAVSGAIATVTPAENLGARTFTLKVSTAVEDTQGRKLEFPHTQLFAFGDDEQPPSDGRGFLTGEVYDATTGRPLAGAEITIDVPTAAFARNARVAANAVTTQAVTMTTDARGRYGDRFPEGAHTIRASANGYTSVWRQIIVPAGAGVIPIDIRLTKRGETKTAAAGELKLTHGGDKIARRAELTVPAGGITAGATVTLTSTGAQSLAGLLPLGWSPLASAEIVSSANSLGAAKLTFDVPATDIQNANQSLTAVRYDETRDEWHVLNGVVPFAGGKATIDVDRPGAYALVYGDRRSGLAELPNVAAGGPLAGVKDPCADGACAQMVAESFPLDPEVVLPNGSTTATLNIKGTDTADAKHQFPSGTAVQAYIDEELRLADGGRELDPPFATDLLLYRDLQGNRGIATFTLAPSPRAAQVFLEVGFENIRILPYPGRLDRGTLIGSEGGRVPADEKVSVEIPTGATQVELHAEASSIGDATSLGPIAGYTILGGLHFELARVGEDQPADVDGDGDPDVLVPVELTRPARATFTVDATQVPANAQLILVELLDQTVFGGRLFRLTAEMTALDANRWTTKSIDRDVLPVDGIIREGRYLLLAANAPIAFAKGLVRNTDGIAASGARVQTPGLGVADLSRVTGIFNIPVPAAPAAPFQLIPRIASIGDGVTYAHPSAPAPAQVVNVGDLTVVAQPPRVDSTIPVANATGVSPTTTVEVTFAPGIDSSSAGAKSLTVIDPAGFEVKGTITPVGSRSILWTIEPGEALQQGTRYTASVASTVRGSNGTPLGQPFSFSFTTAAVVTSTETHPERIQISMPAPDGTAQITGMPGALLKGWIAIPVRRGNDFRVRYTAEVENNDGSFALTIGGGDPRDAITIADEIDLRVLNNNGALAAIIPLTPFVTADGRGFIAPPKSAVTFNSIDGIKVVVPAGSFDVPTLINVEKVTAAAFSSVPNLTQELNVVSGVRLTFEGRAQHKLEVTLPVAAGTPLHDKYILGLLGESVRGPRIAPIDMLFVSNGALTNKRPAGNNLRAGVLRATTNALNPNADPQDFLLGAQYSGVYAAFIMNQIETTPYVWAFLDNITSPVEMFIDTWSTLYTSTKFRAEEGVIAFPVPIGTKFSITGIDPATALVSFEEPYAAIPIGGAGGSVVLASPQHDVAGPHPVFGGPFRIETVEAPPYDVPLESVRNLKFTLSDTGELSVGPGSVPFDETETRVYVLDADTGKFATGASLPLSLSDVRPGHRLVVTIETHDVDPASEIQVVFSEPISVPAVKTVQAMSEELKKLVKLEQIPEDSGAEPIDLLRAALLKLDSAARRISILLPSALPTDEKFRLTLKSDIKDQSADGGLSLGQVREKNEDGTTTLTPASPQAMELWFSTSSPKGKLATFEIRQRSGVSIGSIREIAEYDNLLFVAAVEGGILAYDTSDPVALGSPNSKAIAVAPGMGDGDSATSYWSVNVDHHGRVYTTGVGHMFGYFRSYRVEDFIRAENDPDTCGAGTNRVCETKQVGAAILSQIPGSGAGVGMSTVAVTYDRVEAIPRKMKVVLGDEPSNDYTRKEFLEAFGGTSSGPANGLQRITVSIPATTKQHRLQRITVENVSLGLRWSADARATGGGANLPPAQFSEIVAGPGDILRVTRNLTTHGVINLFGYGMGVFDLNAIESNDQPALEGTTGFSKPKEQVALRANAYDPAKGVSSSTITNIAFSPHAEILATAAGSLRFYAYDAQKGVVEFAVALPENIYRNGETVLNDGVPRWKTFKTKLASVVPNANVRFNTGALYRNANTKKHYLLVAAVDAGLVVLQGGAAPMDASSFADVIWFPQGAWAVRVIENTNNALVVDRKGAVHLVDLSRIDERDLESVIADPTRMFPTAYAAMSATGFHGVPDPRILWSSPEGVAMGNVPPVMNAETGFFFSGGYSTNVLTNTISTGSAVNPQIKFMYDNGGRLRETATVVPLGIEQPKDVLKCKLVADEESDPEVDGDNCRASLGVFRVEAMLPGSMDATTSEPLRVAIESERVAGVEMPQVPTPYPVSHLRQRDRAGDTDDRASNDFKLQRVLEPYATEIPSLRYQKGWNRFVTDWIVAIADPRAAKDYGDAPEDCPSCKRPKYLADLDTREIYTTGRFLAVRPEFEASGGYGWMGEDKRLTARVSTIPADTVRPREALIAAQVPPVAEGMLQETTYVHSGEVETSNVDFDAGGRAGWNVVFDRTYRSRTIGLSPLGTGWESSMFRRLRALPDGDVEYRDGQGEIWRFKAGREEYVAPTGLFLRLARGDSGWIMIDQQWRITRFDDLGRLVSESDEFYDPKKPGSGNVVVYTYDADGRLSRIIDPVGRENVITYNDEGLLATIDTWHKSPNRLIEYGYTDGRLTSVKLPEVANTDGVRPEIKYDYTNASGGYKDKLELPNLWTITDPAATAPRVTLEYETSGDYRDRVKSQRWAEGETATITWSDTPKVTDALGHDRTYTLSENSETDFLADRAHVTQIDEQVPVWDGATFGNLPATLEAEEPSTTSTTRTRTFTYEQGAPKTSEIAGLVTSVTTYESASGAPGKRVKSANTTAQVSASAALPEWMPPQASLSREFHYQAGDNASTFLSHVMAGGKKIESVEPHRYETDPTSSNSEIAESEKYDLQGRLTDVQSSGGNDPETKGSKASIEYWPDDAEEWKRGLPRFVREGTAPILETSIDYTETEKTEKDPRGVVKKTTYDTWHRPKEIHVTKSGSPDVRELYEYDAAGRIRKIVRLKSEIDPDSGKFQDRNVATEYTYDKVGRAATVKTDQLATVGSTTTVMKIDLVGTPKRIVTTRPGGSVTTVDVDSVGRVVKSETTTGSSPIISHFAYDLAGNRVFATDLLAASATAYDIHGRAIAAMAADGTISTTTYDNAGRIESVKELAAAGAIVLGESNYSYTDAGHVKLMQTKVDSDSSRATTFAWDGGGRITGVATGGRAAKMKFDEAGRILEQTLGGGSATSVTDLFTKTTTSSHEGRLPAAAITQEKDGGSWSNTVQGRDIFGTPSKQTLGTLEWEQKRDQSGDLLQSKPPGRPASTWKVDARGAVVSESLGDGAKNEFVYDGSGSQTTYTDPLAEPTITVPDLLGRPVDRTYADGTTEHIEYQGSRVKSVTDRQGRKQTYGYNGKGQLETITPEGSASPSDRLTYDEAGRLVSWKTPDSEVTWSGFNKEGAPKKTSQTRFKSHSGFEPLPVVLDRFEQTHKYNEHGERTDYTLPTPEGGVIGSGWAAAVHHDYDAMGNVKLISRGSTLMTASYHNAGRAKERTVTTSGGATIARKYGYDENASLLQRMTVEVGGRIVAGSEVTHEGLLKKSEQLLGVASSARYTHWGYDARGRVQGSVTATSSSADPFAATPGRAIETLSPADFRTSQTRQSRFDEDTLSKLTGVDTSRVDPPSVTFEVKPGGGHKVGRVLKGKRDYSYTWNGSERETDGRFKYVFDAKGRLISATELGVTAPKRRVLYTYSGTGRLIGRRAEYTNDPNPTGDDDWNLEDRMQVFAADGLPADTTFVWDPVSDNLLAVYKAGAPEEDIHGGLLKQVIHGGSSYDDPIETITVDPITQQVTQLYPVYDEAGAGSLQAVLNKNGEVIARTLQNDMYGADNVDFAGAAIDRVHVTVTKSSSGAVESATVTMHATEELTEMSLATGIRLAAVDAKGNLVRLATGTPALAEDDKFTVEWTLTGAQWAALTDSSPVTVGGASRTADRLSIAATWELRAAAWGANVPVMSAPEWAIKTQNVRADRYPVEVFEPFTTLGGFIEDIPAGEEKASALYEVDSLALTGGAAETMADEILSARMHAHPFTDGMTGLNYVRARWYDPLSGTWLSADPSGFLDSSNVYAFAGGDPVNGKDPTGAWTAKDIGDWVSTKIEVARDYYLDGDEGVAKDFAVNTVADIAQIVPGVLSMGTQSGTELGEGQTLRQVAGNRAYETLPMEEARALIQDWDYLSDAERARLIAMGISKTAGVIAGTAGGVQTGGNLVRAARAPKPTPAVTPAPAAPAPAPSPSPTVVPPDPVVAPPAPRVRGGAEPVRTGQAGEAVGTEMSGYPKNTRRIPSASRKKDYRVPDHMNDTGRHIVEDKAVDSQYLSSQLKDDKAFVLRDNAPGRVDVLIDENTQITLPLLREHLNPGSPIKLKTGKLKKKK